MLHKNIDTLKIWNWNRIIESDEINLKPLFKNQFFTFLEPLMKNKLKGAYMSIIYDFDNLDVEMLRSYILWQEYFLQFRIDLESKILDKILGEDLYIKYQKLEDSFKKYIRRYQKNNKNFEITEYYLTEDYEEKFKEVFELDINENEHLKKLHEFKDIKFYTRDEFNIFCNDYLEIVILTRSDVFYDKLIKSRIIKVEEIEVLDDHLLQIYMKNNIYDKYQFVRAKLFDMHNVESETIKKGSVVDDLTRLNDYLGSNLTLESTVAEYESNKKLAKRKFELEKKDNNGGN